jgi:hypothetical protein
MDLDIKADLLVTCGLSKTHSYALPSPIRYQLEARRFVADTRLGSAGRWRAVEWARPMDPCWTPWSRSTTCAQCGRWRPSVSRQWWLPCTFGVSYSLSLSRVVCRVSCVVCRVSCVVCRVCCHVPAFPPGAFLLKFHPKFSSSLFIVSQNGQIQICEAQGDPTSLQMYQVRVNPPAGQSPNNQFNHNLPGVGFTRPTVAETW